MTTIRQRSGMRGVFLVAAELSRLDYSVALTARNAAGADLMVFSEATSKACSIEVKTNSKRANFWLVGEKAYKVSSRSHFYVFVNISAPRDQGEVIKYYVVPSDVVARKTVVQKRKTSTWCSFSMKDAKPFQDQWFKLSEE